MRIRPVAGAPFQARELWTAGGVFGVLTLIFTYPLSLHPARVVLADVPDTHLFIWTLGWIAHALSHDPLSVFDANIFYPLNHSLAFSENLIGSGLIAAPIIWSTGNYVLALNVVSLLSVALCGIGAYFLARTIGLSVAAAFICGIVFAFCPTRFFRIGQLHLTTVQWIPFALAFLHAYLDRGRPRDARLAILFFTIQALTTGHGAVFLAIAMGGLLVFRVATGVPLSLTRRMRDVGVTGGLALVAALMIAIPYQIVQHQLGLKRFLENWTVPAISFAASPSHVDQAILSWFVSPAWVAETAAAFLFPGYLPILLSIAAVAIPIREGWAARIADQSLFYALLGAFCVLLTVGRPFGLWPLVYWLPGFNFIRVPSRFWILATLAMAVLSAIAFERFRSCVSPQTRIVAFAALALALLGEFSTIPLDGTPFRVRPPAADRWLADQPKPFVVAEMPFNAVPRDQTAYMLHSMAHWQKTVHGYSGFEPPMHTALYETMKRLPQPEAITALRTFGVTYLVVHLDRFSPERWSEADRQLTSSSELELLFSDDRSRVYRLRR